MIAGQATVSTPLTTRIMRIIPQVLNDSLLLTEPLQKAEGGRIKNEKPFTLLSSTFVLVAIINCGF
jgi:hypothetical protein